MVKAIIFDFWGTLVENGCYSPLRQTHQQLAPDMKFGEFVTLFEETFMTKEFDDLHEAFQDVCSALNISYNEGRVEEIIGIWNKCWLLAQVYGDTVKTLEMLRQSGVKIALISNCQTNSVRNVLKKHDLEKYFDFIHLSCETGVLKNNPEGFKSVLSSLDVKPEEALMIGDSIDTDIKGAEEAGIPAMLLDRRNRRQWEGKIRHLYALKEYI